MNTASSDNLEGLRYLLLNEAFSLSHLVLVKILGIEFAPVQIVFIRCLSSAVLLVPLLAWHYDEGVSLASGQVVDKISKRYDV